MGRQMVSHSKESCLQVEQTEKNLKKNGTNGCLQALTYATNAEMEIPILNCLGAAAAKQPPEAPWKRGHLSHQVNLPGSANWSTQVCAGYLASDKLRGLLVGLCGLTWRLGPSGSTGCSSPLSSSTLSALPELAPHWSALYLLSVSSMLLPLCGGFWHWTTVMFDRIQIIQITFCIKLSFQ